LATVIAATALLVVADVDLAFASITLLLVVAGASVFGYAPGVLAAVSSSALLTYYFTPPVHSFSIDQPDDLLALVAFVLVSLLVGAAIARLNELRRRAEVSAREAALRVELTYDLRRGMPVRDVLARLASELEEMFELAECSISAPPDRVATTSGRAGLAEWSASSPPVELHLSLGRVLRVGEAETITGLAEAVGTTLELERVDAEAREQRIRSELDRSRLGFLTAVTHDLRTPLATISGATSALLARDSPLDADERRELLEDTFAETARLQSLVDKVLELTRIRSGAMQADPVAVSAADLVRVAVGRLAPSASERTINLDVDADLPPLHVDPLLMEHVLVNLLENAVLHDPAGGEIDVRGTASDCSFTLTVIDHGPGIPVVDRERVFAEFVRRRATTDGPGTGLGLAIVRALVTANGGRVWCEATSGGGATFVLELPITDDEEPQ